jgi:hypothetical protein
MASIRSASIGPFGSFMTSGEGLKLPVSEFHPILRQYSRCPFSRLSCTADSQRSNRGPPDIGACGPSESRSYRCSGDTKKIEWWPGAGEAGLPRMHSLCIRPAERVRLRERRDYEPRHIRAITRMVARAESNHRHADFQSGEGDSKGLLINHLQRLPAPSPGTPWHSYGIPSLRSSQSRHTNCRNEGLVGVHS